MKYIVVSVVSIFVMILVCSGCLAATGGDDMINVDFEKVSLDQWNSLNSKKIFFGHHSVGTNIIKGIKKLNKNSPYIDLNILKTTDPISINESGILAHGKVGENFDPISKIESFRSIMESGVGNKVDIAFMKFCFVDIGTQTDLIKIFDNYRNTMAQLKKEFPAITFVHVTVPLVLEPEGIKANAKKIIKKMLVKNNLYENTAKAHYNQLIRNEYSGKEPIFDLAEFESTYPDRSRLTYTVDDMEYEALIPEYAADVGHLNKQGQEVVAKALLAFLASLD